MKGLLVVIIVLIMIGLSSCVSSSAEGSQIDVQDPWVRAVTGVNYEAQEDTGSSEGGQSQMMGLNSAAYMLLRNTGGTPDRLLKVDSDVAKAVEIHISEMKDGVMSMHPVEFVDVPAGAETELKPGGLHIMLIGLKRNVPAGDTVKLTLHFEEFGYMEVEAEVRSP